MKKILITFLSVIMFCSTVLFVGCNDDNYIWAEAKTFNNKNFTITASVDYIQDNSYGEEVLVLEGLNGESIVVCYNEINSTISNSVDEFIEAIKEIDNLEVIHGKGGSININNDNNYTFTEAKYFAFKSQKTWQNGSETPEREEFYVHYNLLIDEFYYDWLAVTAKVGNGFVVAYIGGRESTFNKKFNEYLTYAKSLLVNPVVKESGDYQNIFSNEMKYTSENVFTSGIKFKVPNDFKYYMLNGVIQNNLITCDLIDGNKTYGSVSVRAYNENWTSTGTYCVLHPSIIEMENFEINKHLVKIGQAEELGFYFKKVNHIVNEEHYQGQLNEVMYFKTYTNNRTYAFEIIFNIYYEDDETQDDYNDYVFHSYGEDLKNFANYLEKESLEWIKEVELL